jgi:hypothetical protein
LTERDNRTMRKIILKNHRNIAAQATRKQNWLFILKTLFFTKTVRRELHRSNIHGRTAIAEPLIIESNARIRKRWRHNHKTWTSYN